MHIYSSELTPLHSALQTAGFTDFIDKAVGLTTKAKDIAKHALTEHVEEVAKGLKLTKEQVQLAFKEPKPQNLLKACGYSIATMHGAFDAAHRLADHGVMAALVHIAGHQTMHKLGHKAKDKAKDADGVLKKYPALKLLTGPAIAGLMLYGYTTAPTPALGDWDLSKVAKAFKGGVSVEEFVQSSEAHALGTHLATGHGMSLAALAGSSVNLCIGLAATAINNSDNPKLKELASSIKDRVSKLLPSKKASDQAISPTEKEDKNTEKEVEKDEKPPESKETLTNKKTNPSWWQRKSSDSKDNYLKEHPDSTLTPASFIQQASAIFAAVNPTKPYKPRKLKTDPYHTMMRKANKLKRPSAAKKAASARSRKQWLLRNKQALQKRSAFIRKARKNLGMDKSH